MTKKIFFTTVLAICSNLFGYSKSTDDKCDCLDFIDGVEATSSSPKWILVYDFKTGDFVYGKKKECNEECAEDETCFQQYVYVPKDYLRPPVRQELGFKAINYHPYRDSLTVGVSFFNRHMELAGNFMKLSGTGSSFPGGQTQAAAEAVAAKIVSVAPTSDELKKDITDLSSNLSIAYVDLSSTALLTEDVIIDKLEEINKSIGTTLKDLDVLTVSDLLLNRAAIVDQISVNEQIAVNGLIDQIKIKYVQLTSFNKFIFSSEQVKNSDGTKFVVKRFRDGEQIGGDISKEFNNKDGFKLDFSSGLYATTLKDFRYTTKTVSVRDTSYYVDVLFNTTDSVLGISDRDENRIIREDEGEFSVGIAVFSHFYWRMSRRVNGSLTLGFGVNNNALTNYLVGSSILLGKKQRFVVSAGAAFGQVERLASGLEIGQDFQVPNNQTDAIPTRKEWNVSWFVGVSYNFGGVTF